MNEKQIDNKNKNIILPRIILINTFISNEFKQKEKFCSNIIKTSKYNL
jgi:hypothetical protein